MKAVIRAFTALLCGCAASAAAAADDASRGSDREHTERSFDDPLDASLASLAGTPDATAWVAEAAQDDNVAAIEASRGQALLVAMIGGRHGAGRAAPATPLTRDARSDMSAVLAERNASEATVAGRRHSPSAGRRGWSAEIFIGPLQLPFGLGAGRTAAQQHFVIFDEQLLESRDSLSTSRQVDPVRSARRKGALSVRIQF